MKNKSVSAIGLLLTFSPFYAFAEDATLKSIVSTFTSVVVQSIMGLFVATATAVFFYGIFRYIWGIREGDETKVRAGNQLIIWGLVSLFVMTSAWGIVKYAQNIFGIDTKTTIVIPNANLK
jgi:hypothetical protein